MNNPAEIVFRNMKSNPELSDLVNERMEKLEHFYQHIVSCRVVIELQNHTHRSGNIPDVHIDLAVPGQVLVVNHKLGDAVDAHAAVHKAFDAAAQQLKEYKARRTGHVKQHGEAALSDSSPES